MVVNLEEIGGKIIRKLFKIGDSIAVTIPPDFLKAHGIDAGTKVEILYNNAIVIKPINVSRIIKQVHKEVEKGGKEVE